MKYLSFFIVLSLFIILSSNPVDVVAQAPTKSQQTEAAGTEQGKLEEQIDELKEKIASRVSELNLVEKRGVIGIIDEVSGNKITVIDVHSKKRIIDVDEITKFSSAGTKTTFGLSDLKKGMRISTIGLYNKQSERVLGRFIEVTVNPTVVSGVITEIDEDNFQFVVTSVEGSQTTIDVATTSRISSYAEGEALARLGFSKIAVGERVIVLGYPSKTDKELIVATRGIVFPGLPAHPNISVAKPTDVVDTTPLPTKATQ